MAFIIPNIFIAGEKAIAEDINVNFEYLRQSLESVNTALDTKINNKTDDINSALSDAIEAVDTKVDTINEIDKTVVFDTVTTAGTVLQLLPDKAHRVTVNANASVKFPDCGDKTYAAFLLEFIIKSGCSLSLPSVFSWSAGITPIITANGSSPNIMVAYTTTGGTWWRAMYIS